MKRTVNIDGIDVELKCTGATPTFYRNIFNHDLFKEFASLSKAMTTDSEGNTSMDLTQFDFGIVERLAYTMAFQANRDLGPLEEWLDQFDHSTAILDAMPDILQLYMDGLNTSSEVKKKNAVPSVR